MLQRFLVEDLNKLMRVSFLELIREMGIGLKKIFFLWVLTEIGKKTSLFLSNFLFNSYNADEINSMNFFGHLKRPLSLCKYWIYPVYFLGIYYYLSRKITEIKGK